jgi:hypothetical protein
MGVRLEKLAMQALDDSPQGAPLLKWEMHITGVIKDTDAFSRLEIPAPDSAQA